MTYVLNLSHVSLQRGDTQILSDVSWSTRPRQHWVIVGPNGAGKTTLARVASGRIAPDSGEVTVSETDLAQADPAEVATRVGLASAAVGAKIVPTQSVLDTVRSAAWGLAVAHDEEYEQVDDERAHALMDIFGVSHLAQREFSTLSEGEAQRVLLAFQFAIQNRLDFGIELAQWEVIERIHCESLQSREPGNPRILPLLYPTTRPLPRFRPKSSVLWELRPS